MHLSLGKKDICWHTQLLLLWIFISCGSLTNTSVLHDTRSNNFAPYRGRSYKQSPLCHAGDYSSVNGKTCQDLQGIGSLNSTCLLNSELLLDGDLCLYGTGNLEISAHVSIKCPVKGCYMIFNISGSFKIGPYAVLTAGSIAIEAANITLEQYSSINTTSLGGSPPAQTSGTPSTFDRSGGGHGGRGASCTKYNKTNWGGDVYAWSTLSDPWSYGSKGGSASADMQYGGGGGGRIMLEVKDTLYIDGFVSADGGEGGLWGGGGSGGSILIHALKLKGKGFISAAGGRGWGGGGGGRISLACYSRQDVQVTVHGGRSIGCPDNAGAAGTIFDKTMHSLKVGNANLSTETETPLLDFPAVMLWSDVFVEDNAKVLVPLLWTRVQVRGQIKLVNGGHISFGLSEFPVSEFELVAEELLMSESVIKVFGAFRMYVKMLLMWDSRIQIDGGGETEASTSFLEARNLVVLRHKSVICSNAVLGVNGQGLLKLSGPGDTIKGQRLFLSLFYNIEIGPGSILQAPLDDNLGSSSIFQTFCPSQTCPMELIAPPDDCHVNSSLPLTVQICRVEDLIIYGMIKGSVLLVHRARTVTINDGGTITASGLGCKNGIGEGKFLGYGAGGGGGHGGKGGSGFFNGTFVEGGKEYGDADFPCELGTGSGGPTESMHVAGGGLIVVGSKKWPLSRLEIFGSLRADGQSREELYKNPDYTATGGLGGGSGGTILLFMQAVVAGDHSLLSTSGGNGSPVGGGGGGGGRVHFHWLDIATGDEYVKIASVNGTIAASGGNGTAGGRHGSSGTVTGSTCPKGLFGTFCNECPVGTYKNVIGSDPSLCVPCSLSFLPRRAVYTYVRGGVTQPSCPYKCLSEKYKMPKCYTPLEELVYAFGGPWPFVLALSFLLVLLAFLLSALRVKVVGTDHQSATSIHSEGSGSFPFLLSLAQVQGTSKAEETQSHVHRMYFMGPNTFREPWHLPHSPPEAIVGIVYEDAFNRFIDEVNSVAAYEWWQGSVYFILSVVAYPCAWSWKQWCRRTKIHRLQEYVKSEYDHACLRSCRSRALYKGMKVGSTPDLMVAYIDFFLGGDEKHLVVTSTLSQRFPMCIIFGGDGSYMIPYQLQNDTLLSNLIGQLVPPSTWNRFMAGLNVQLRTVRQGTIRSGLGHIISWLNSHGYFQLEHYGVRVEMGWFQATASGYYQLGILVCISEHLTHRSDILDTGSTERTRRNAVAFNKGANVIQQNQPCVNLTVTRKRVTGGVSGGKIDEIALKSLDYRRDYLFPFSLLLRNRRPVGLQETLQLLIAFVLLADFTITLLMLLQFYWISLVTFFAVLLILPLSLLSTFPAGLNALFSRGHKRSSLARIYALWNMTSLSNILVSFVCGISYYGVSRDGLSEWSHKWKADRDDGEWWALPMVLLILKLLQSVFINWHIANLEIQDHSLFSQDPQRFWAS